MQGIFRLHCGVDANSCSMKSVNLSAVKRADARTFAVGTVKLA